MRFLHSSLPFILSFFPIWTNRQTGTQRFYNQFSVLLFYFLFISYFDRYTVKYGIATFSSSFIFISFLVWPKRGTGTVEYAIPTLSSSYDSSFVSYSGEQGGRHRDRGKKKRRNRVEEKYTGQKNNTWVKNITLPLFPIPANREAGTETEGKTKEKKTG